MSQIAEPVIAGLEVVEHFGEAREVLARLMALPAPRARRALSPASAAFVELFRSEHARCLELSWRLAELFPRVSRAYADALPAIEDAIAGSAGRSARALRLDAMSAIGWADEQFARSAALSAAGAL